MSPASDPLPVAPGTHIDLELVCRSGQVERLSLTVTFDERADFAAGQLGAGTPLARLLLGRLAGEVLPYTAGDLVAVRLLAVRPADGEGTGQAADRRRSATRRAVEQAEFTQAATFAASVDTKWGAYDPDGLDPERWSLEKDEADPPAEDGQ